MISEGRLSGFVDQIESVLHFQGSIGLFVVTIGDLHAIVCSCLASEQLAQWDRRIESFCVQVNQVLDRIQAVHPDWCVSTMALIEEKINAATRDDEEDAMQAESSTTDVKAMDVS